MSPDQKELLAKVLKHVEDAMYAFQSTNYDEVRDDFFIADKLSDAADMLKEIMAS